jgi:hypothetical protein
VIGHLFVIHLIDPNKNIEGRATFISKMAETLDIPLDNVITLD